MSLSESKHFLDGYEQAYNLQRALPRGPIRRQAAIDALNVLDILGFSTGAGFLVVSEELLFQQSDEKRPFEVSFVPKLHFEP